MRECKVSVVIPNYNGLKYIENCMESLNAIKDECLFHTVVVDNGSKDGSLEVIRNKYPWAELIALPENTGFCHAVNVGIENSKTSYVLLLNNDTVVKSGFVKCLQEAIEEAEDIFSVSSMMLAMQDESIIDDAGDRYCALGWAYARGKGKSAEKYEKKVEVFAACGGASLYRKSVFEQIGLFDENHFAYLEDVDIGYRARIFGYRNLYEPTAKVIHAGSATSGSRYNEFKTGLASANSAYVIGKNLPLLLILINLPFLFLGFLVKAFFFTLKKMGMLYIRGYVKGISRCFSKEGRKHHIKFQMKHFLNYCKVEIWQIWGIFGYFMKY
jgi:GT2 family glycosyltransferase